MEVSYYSGADALPFAEDCAAIHTAAFAASGSRGWSVDEFTSLLQRDTVFLLKTTSGLLIADLIVGEVEVLTVAVHPNEQNKGIGSAILQKLDNVCTCRNVTKCFLEVATDNIAAKNLYHAFSFKKIAIRERYYTRGVTAISAMVMEKVFATV